MRTQAVIYCRVSTQRQIIEGNGLASQESACRNYARLREYEVIGIFQDGITGGTDDRRGLQQMLSFLRQQLPGIVVIIDDIKRFAREVEVHFGLKRAIHETGARLESPLFRFEDTPEGKFIETMMAAQAELERNQNKRQVMSRMRARLETGFWVFPPPIGYYYDKHPIHKKALVPTLKARAILGPLLEDYGRGRIQTKRELGLRLQASGFFEDAPPVSLKVLEDRVWRMFQLLPLYAGQLEYRRWKIDRRPAQHEAILSAAGLARIEERLYAGESPISPDRADISASFPLRNFLRCSGCGRPLTGSIAKGKYPRYHCYYQRCPMYGKSFGAEKKVEPLFREFLRSITPTPALLEALALQLPESWNKQSGETEQTVVALRQELDSIHREVQGYVRRLGKASDVIAEEIEREIETLKRREMHLHRQIAEAGEEKPRIEEAWEAVHTYFSRPLEVWESGSESQKKTLLRMVFTQPPTFEPEKGLNTSNLSLPYRVSQVFGHTKAEMVEVTSESWHQMGESFLEWSDWVA